MRLAPISFGIIGIPFFYYEIIEGGHATGANLKESAATRAVDYVYLTRKLMD